MLPQSISNRITSLIRHAARSSNLNSLSTLATYFDYKDFHAGLKENISGLKVSKQASQYLEQICEHGICIIDNFWGEEKCRQARAEVDRIIDSYPEYVHPSAKADKRVYGANNVSELISEFNTNPLLTEIANAYNEEPTRAAFTLAARLPVEAENLGSGEGWHRDAFFRQFKAIIYLSDVGPDNGPFQMLKDSQQTLRVLSDIKAGKLGYMQYRLDDDEVERILKKEPERLITYTAKAGTLILVDTSTIHRGKPIEKGIRYALTNYYFQNDRIDSAMYEKFNVVSKI